MIPTFRTDYHKEDFYTPFIFCLLKCRVVGGKSPDLFDSIRVWLLPACNRKLGSRTTAKSLGCGLLRIRITIFHSLHIKTLSLILMATCLCTRVNALYSRDTFLVLPLMSNSIVVAVISNCLAVLCCALLPLHEPFGVVALSRALEDTPVAVEAAQTCQIRLRRRNLDLEAHALVPRALRSPQKPQCSGIAHLRLTNESFRTETGVFHVHRSLSLASRRTSLGKSIAACAIRMKE